MNGTGALFRLAVRLDRVRLTVWILVIGLLPALTAAQYRQLYPTAQDLAQAATVVDNPSLIALSGRLLTNTSIGGLTAWKIGITEFILVAIMAILTVVRHTRADEETGRSELLHAGVLGRRAALTAALLTAALTAVASGLLAALGLLGTKQPAAGSFAFGTAIAIVGLVFAAVAGVTAQLSTGTRTATGAACAALGAAYLLRAIGDTGPRALSWISPLGWATRMRPYAGEAWWVALPGLSLAAVLAICAYRLVGRRDLGAGLLADRPGPAAASDRLSGVFGLAARLHRGPVLGWLAAFVICGALFGGTAKSIGTAHLTNSDITDVLARLGGSGALVDAFLAAIMGILGLLGAVYAVQATLRMRGEEAAGRLEPLLATPAGRIRWALSHLVFAVVVPAVLLAAAGAAAGLAYGAQVHDAGGQLGRLTVAAVVQAPATWVLTGAGTALFGLAPKLSGLAWAILAACLVVLEIGAVLGLSHWVLDVSPFAHVPKLPGAAFTAAPLLWLTLIAAALAATGLTAFRHRDAG